MNPGRSLSLYSLLLLLFEPTMLLPRARLPATAAARGHSDPARKDKAAPDARGRRAEVLIVSLREERGRELKKNEREGIAKG